MQAAIHVWDRETHFTWSMLVKGPRGPYKCRIDSVAWRKYKTFAGARDAAERMAHQLGVEIPKVYRVPI